MQPVKPARVNPSETFTANPHPNCFLPTLVINGLAFTTTSLSCNTPLIHAYP